MNNYLIGVIDISEREKNLKFVVHNFSNPSVESD